MEENKRLSAEELEKALGQFCNGTDEITSLYPHVSITDGVKFLCQQAQCLWLIDVIASYQFLPRVAQEAFQVIDLRVDVEHKKGHIEVGDGNEHIIHRQEIPYTDFPLAHIRLYYTDDIVLLPQEY